MKKARDLGQVIRRRNFLTTTQQAFKVDQMDSCERYSYNPTLHWNPQVEEYFIKAYGADRFCQISKALTRPSCYSCIRVNTLKSTSEAVIEKLTAILQETRPESNIHCISTSATADVHIGKEQKGFYKDHNLESFPDLYSRLALGTCGDGHAPKAILHRPPICKCELPGIDNVLFVKGSGPHMVDYGDAHTQPVKEVIVSRKCAEAVLRGAQIFVPGVLACSAHVEKGDTVVVSVAVEQPGLDSRWGVGITRGTVLQGLQTDPHYLERNGLYIGQGTTMMSRTGIFRSSEGIAVEMTNRVFNLASFNDVLEGEIFLQNLPSIITAHVLDPQPRERILDMCAAPGGKTTAIAILMRDKGEVVAVDRSHNKVLDILKLAAEMGLHCITTCKLDALKSVCRPKKAIDVAPPNCEKEILGVSVEDSGLPGVPKEEVSSNNTEVFKTDLTCLENVSNGNANQRIYLSKADIRKNTRRMRNGPGRNHCMGDRVEISKGFNPNSFDRVLLDAPCSALGLRPRLFAGEETMESLRHHGKYQRKMFDQAVQLVRPGGVIVYSTCTINPGENEALVRYALDTYKFLSLAPQHPRVGGPGLVGHCEMFDGKFVEEWLRHDEAELVQRFDPSSPLDTIGFFIAKFNVGQKDI